MDNHKIFKMFQSLAKPIGLFIVAIAVVSGIGLSSLPAFKTKDYFKSQPIEISSYDIFDLGVADVNEDGNLDIFTTNHSSQQSLLMNQTKGKFVDRLSQLNLDQDYSFPKVEVTDAPPKLDKAGLYIFREKYFQRN